MGPEWMDAQDVDLDDPKAWLAYLGLPLWLQLHRTRPGSVVLVEPSTRRVRARLDYHADMAAWRVRYAQAG